MATNEQRREAAKRKLERQLEHRAERVKRNRVIGVGATVGVVVLAVGLIVFLATRGEEAPASADGDAKANDIEIPTERADVPERSKPLADPSKCTYQKGPEEAAKKVKPPKNGEVKAKGTVEVTLETSAGDIGLTLDRELAPCTVNSMVSLIKQGYYDGSECHRIGTEGLQMLQCGDPTGTGSGGPGYTVPDEFFDELSYGRGILAMANTGQPDSGGGQFFMVFGEAQLPPQYTVFGTISDEGLQVIDQVAQAGHDGAFDPQPGGGKPNTPVKFEKVTINA